MAQFSNQPHPTSEPEIPVLKTEKEEKKRGAVPLPGLRGAGVESVLSRVLSTRLGAMLGVVGVSVGAVAIAAGYAWFGTVNEPPRADRSGPPLRDAVRSTIVIKRPNDGYLSGLSAINKGEISYDTGASAVAAKAGGAPVDTEALVPPPVPDETPTASNKENLITDQFLRKMQRHGRDMAGGSSAGSQLANSLQASAPKFGSTNFFGLGATPSFHAAGTLGTQRPGAKKLTASLLSVKSGISNRAMGQLKLAKSMSSSGASSAGAESSRTYAADAFDQSKTNGGKMTPIAGSDIVVPPSDALPPPTPVKNNNTTPYQNKVDQAQKAADQAAQMQNTSTMMLIIGGLLLAAGLALMMNPATMTIGGVMMAAGAALLALGFIMMMQSQQKVAEGKQIASQISTQSGQKEQGQSISACMDQAGGGVQSANCAPPKVTVQRGRVQQDAEAERNATFHFVPGTHPPGEPGTPQ